MFELHLGKDERGFENPEHEKQQENLDRFAGHFTALRISINTRFIVQVDRSENLGSCLKGQPLSISPEAAALDPGQGGIGRPGACCPGTTGADMRLRVSTIAAIAGILLLSNTAAAALDTRGQDEATSGVSDLMLGIQLRHIKLWFAGKLKNWPLATYELDIVRSRLKKAQELSADLRPEQTLALVEQLQGAIDARDSAGFVKSYTELTNACNACHRATGRSYITIQIPATAPFTNELFVDQVAEGRGLAHSICGNCHFVTETPKEIASSGFPAPSFASLAQRSSVTDESLRLLLSSSHRNLGPDKTMPNPRLADYQIEEIIAYFGTLRGRDH
jgi:mono/diheme cytochrome c family protein